MLCAVKRTAGVGALRRCEAVQGVAHALRQQGHEPGGEVPVLDHAEVERATVGSAPSASAAARARRS